MPPPWFQLARLRGWVRIVLGYRAKTTNTDGAEYFTDALAGHVITADVPLRL